MTEPITPDRIHVWKVALGTSDHVEASSWSVLADDEVQRARRFRFAPDRDRFVVCRAALRSIMGRYLGLAPETLRFAASASGKPHLCPRHHRTSLRFNVSHSRNLALIAVSTARELGVDVEGLRPLRDADAIVARFFSAREHAAFAALPAGQRLETFFTWWTGKEAYLKGRGDGLRRALDSFELEVDIRSGEARVLDRADPGHDGAPWIVRRLRVGGDHAAALAAQGRDWSLAQFDFRGESGG
jgi:4'-phosphopantetheinyl transferase